MAEPTLPSYVDHLIVGSGFAGLCAAIRLALDSEGRNPTLWPRTTYTFRRLLARFDPEAYDVQAARDETESAKA